MGFVGFVAGVGLALSLLATGFTCFFLIIENLARKRDFSMFISFVNIFLLLDRDSLKDWS